MAAAMNEGRAALAEENGEDVEPISEEEAAEVVAEAVAEGEAESTEETTEEA
jgi:small subunit ribosomal protein S2